MKAVDGLVGFDGVRVRPVRAHEEGLVTEDYEKAVSVS